MRTKHSAAPRAIKLFFIYILVLALVTSYVLLDTFVIPDAQQTVIAAENTETTEDTQEETEPETSADTNEAVVSDTSYQDENISITLTETRVNDTAVYLADVQVSDASYLKTAFADGIFGRNIKETTSDIAEENGAILAINGDYYGFRDYGYVLRNGTLYRGNGTDTDDLVIGSDGSFSFINESETSAEDLLSEGALQVLSFGPVLLEDGEIKVTESSEVGRSMSSNPRTAVGMISPLHYVFLVSDGRTDESAGLDLIDLAEILSDLGCTDAYNLDGGGSSTMYFNGQVVNNPTGGHAGHGSSERSVSDIVYIGY